MQKKGFTLIELLIVISIIGIVMAIILTSFSGEQDKSAVRATAQIILTAVKDTQNSALAGRRVDDKRSCLFRINIATNSTVQRAHVYDPSDPAQSCAVGFERGVLIVQKSYGTGATVTTPPGIIDFDVPHGTAVHAQFAGGSPVITVPIERASAQAVVCIYRSGRTEALMNTHTCPT